MALQAGFILILCTSFYLMLSFYTRTQQTLTARQKGEKVIAYVDARIRNTGLGLKECDSSEEVRDALCKITNLTGMRPKLTLPVGITSGDGSNVQNNTTKEIRGDKIIGNILTLLYTQRPLDMNFTIRTTESTEAIVSGCNYPLLLSSDTSHRNDVFAEVGFVLGSNSKYNDTASEFNKNNSNNIRVKYLNSYTAMAGTGRPLYIGPVDNGKFNLYLFSESSSVYPAHIEKIYPGDELLYLKCERMFVENQNFKFWNFSENSWDEKKLHSNELGILEIYFELDTTNNILDMYVLASGGINDSGTTQKPAAWPSDFWKSDYENYIVYMSRASWKLHNLPSGFDWN